MENCHSALHAGKIVITSLTFSVLPHVQPKILSSPFATRLACQETMSYLGKKDNMSIKAIIYMHGCVANLSRGIIFFKKSEFFFVSMFSIALTIWP